MIFTLKYVTYLERNIGKEEYQFPKLEDTTKLEADYISTESIITNHFHTIKENVTQHAVQVNIYKNLNFSSFILQLR